MAQPTIDIQPVLDEMTAATTVFDGFIAFVNQTDALREAAVKAAIEADDAGDQGTVDAVVAALKGVSATLTAKAKEASDALLAHTPQAGPPQPRR